MVNPFIASNHINYISNSKQYESFNPDIDRFDEMYNSGVFDYMLRDEDNPMKLNIKEAIEKDEKIKEILSKLPGLDCGSCGAPTCLAHAEDIYDKKSLLSDCVVLRAKEKNQEE